MLETDNKVPVSAELFAHGACAVTSAALVAPFIAIIDQSIFSNASGKEPMAQCLWNNFRNLFTRPTTILKSKSFFWIWVVYGGTYIMANSVELLCVRNRIDWYIPKFFGSSITNATLSLLKDQAFAKMFGVIKPKPLPRTSFALFALRDSLTIGSSFNLPFTISQALQSSYRWNKTVADTTAQLCSPVAMQVFATPFHLLGMDIYNSPAHTAAERAKFCRKEFIKTTAARMGRVFPAFGVGGVSNTFLKKKSSSVLSNLFN
jgi:hypothetical protein